MARKAMTPATAGVDDRGQENVTVNKNNTTTPAKNQVNSGGGL
jgi:hypothetical protein